MWPACHDAEKIREGWNRGTMETLRTYVRASSIGHTHGVPHQHQARVIMPSLWGREMAWQEPDVNRERLELPASSSWVSLGS